MAACRDLASYVDDVTQCSICLSDFSEPRQLPCLHTFCLDCITQHVSRTELEGNSPACPVCRKQFSIPVAGVKQLPHNFFVAGLVEAKKTASQPAAGQPCEVCLALSEGDTAIVSQATNYCVDCQEKICEKCSARCRRGKVQHQVVALGKN